MTKMSGTGVVAGVAFAPARWASARPEVAAGRPVLVHCRAGVHRSVAVAACILITEGRSADEAMRLIKEARPVADPYAWYIQRRIRLFADRWQRRK